MTPPLAIHLTEQEAQAVLDAINTAWDDTRPGTTQRAMERAAQRIEAALRDLDRAARAAVEAS